MMKIFKFCLKRTSELNFNLIFSKNSNFSSHFRPLIDDEFKFTVEAAPDTEMSALTVLVMGKTGLIYSKNHPEADEQKKIEISIPITKEMAPEADLVVFYLKDGNGAPVYDVHKLLVTHTYDNEVSFS